MVWSFGWGEDGRSTMFTTRIHILPRLRIFKANSHMPCRARAVPMPFHAAPLPFSDSAVSFVKVRVVAGNIRTASPTVQRIGMLLITFVELRVLAQEAERGQVSHMPSVDGRC
jgi:hypothetical protein